MSKKRTAIAFTEDDGRLKVRIMVEFPKCNPRAPEANPEWLDAVSPLKLRSLWRSRDRIYHNAIDIRTQIKAYGVERFFAEHREELLFGEDIHRDKALLITTLVEDQDRACRLAARRLLLRFKHERKSINIRLRILANWLMYNVHSVSWDRAVLVDGKGTKFNFFYLNNYELRTQGRRFGNVVWTRCTFDGKDLARCKRLDTIESTVFGAENEAQHARRLGPAYPPSPIADFLNSPLYDKNVWRFITQLL